MGEVRETAIAFAALDLLNEGRFRHFGSEGPLYEIMSVEDSEARIRVIESGEELLYSVAAAAQDPAA